MKLAEDLAEELLVLLHHFCRLVERIVAVAEEVQSAVCRALSSSSSRLDARREVVVCPKKAGRLLHDAAQHVEMVGVELARLLAASLQFGQHGDMVEEGVSSVSRSV